MKRTSTTSGLLSHLLTIIVLMGTAGCGWVDSTGKQADIIVLGATGQDSESIIGLEEETQKLVDLQLFSEEQGEILEVLNWDRIAEGKLGECAGMLDNNIAANSLYEACPSDTTDCELYIVETPDQGDAAYTLSPPRLALPIGLRYDWDLQTTSGARETYQITFCLNASNEVPTANDDDYAVPAAGTFVLDGYLFDDMCQQIAGRSSLLSNDLDDGDRRGGCLRAELVEAPRWARNTFENGFTAGGGFTYQHDPAVGNTEDQFSYRLFDGEHYSAVATVLLSVNNNLESPVADDDNYDVRRNSVGNVFYPMSNDFDPDATDIDIIRIRTQPHKGGSASLVGTNVIVYTPTAGFVGTERMRYTIVNASGLEATATITIRVR